MNITIKTTPETQFKLLLGDLIRRFEEKRAVGKGFNFLVCVSDWALSQEVTDWLKLGSSALSQEEFRSKRHRLNDLIFDWTDRYTDGTSGDDYWDFVWKISPVGAVELTSEYRDEFLHQGLEGLPNISDRFEFVEGLLVDILTYFVSGGDDEIGLLLTRAELDLVVGNR